MFAYYPPAFPDLEVYYHIQPGQEQTFDQKGYEPEVEWEEIEINGRPIGDELHHHFISTFGEKWERDIITSLKARRSA